MQSTIKHISDTKASLTVALDTAEITPIKDRVVRQMGAKLKLAGFRAGKAPQQLLEKSLDQTSLQSEFLETAINYYYAKAITKAGLRPINNPEVSLKKFVAFTTLEFEATVEVVGKITLPDYKKIRQTKPVVKVTDADVKEVLGSLQKRAAVKNDVERKAKTGDQVWIDFTGVNGKGEPVKGADGKDYPLAIGSNTFIPGFEDNMIGLSAGDKKTFTLTFPKDYGTAALAGKDVVFTATVNKVQEVLEPVIDDAFAATVGPFKTAAELKENITSQLKIERQAEADRAFESDLLRQVAAKAKLSVPESIVNDQIERLVREQRQNITYRGQTWVEFLEVEGKTEETYREDILKPIAHERALASLVLSEIAEVEKLQVTPEELEAQMQALKSQYQDKAMQDELDKPENRRDIAGRMLAEKTVHLLSNYATAKKA